MFFAGRYKNTPTETAGVAEGCSVVQPGRAGAFFAFRLS